MFGPLSLFLAAYLVLPLVHAAKPGFPNGKIYGVNLGNWLVFEPWMAEQEWKNMGGQKCDDCSTCIRSEWRVLHLFSNVLLLILTQGIDQGFPTHC